MNNPKVDDFLLFSKVVEYGNFSKTAEHLGMVKSMISKRIGRLESQLGVTLLHRSTRKMTLTEFGATFHEYTTRIQNEVIDAIEAMTNNNEPPKGVLKLALPDSFGNYSLSSMINRFVLEHSELRVELDLLSYMPNLIESDYDAAICVGDFSGSGCNTRLLGEYKMSVCASPSYFAKYGEPESPNDLGSYNCLVSKKSNAVDVWIFEQNNKQTRVKVSGSLSSNSSQALKNAALDGLGVVMLPEYTVRSEIKAGSLKSVFSAFCPSKIDLYAVFPESKSISPKLRVLLDFMGDNL
jgi:DNA-binding transcriptional LysR family regulator